MSPSSASSDHTHNDTVREIRRGADKHDGVGVAADQAYVAERSQTYIARRIAPTSARLVLGLTGIECTLIPKYPAALKNAA